MQTPLLSTAHDNHPDQDFNPDVGTGKKTRRHKPEQDTLEAYSRDALRVLGENYLARKWLPAKGPYFVALILALRAHVYWDFKQGIQKSALFPTAETIAKMSGMRRTKVFELLNDPDMAAFITRRPRRRFDALLNKEVQTSNIYRIRMDDPPLPAHLQREIEPGVHEDDLDVNRVAREEERIRIIESGGDPDDPRLERRLTEPRSSEFVLRTLNSDRLTDSVCRSPNVRKDRMTINNSDKDRRRSATSEDVGPWTIGNEAAPNQHQPPTTKHITTQATKDEDYPIKSTSEGREISFQRDPSLTETRVSVNQTTLSNRIEIPVSSVLSEGEAYKADARAYLDVTRLVATRKTVLEHQMDRYGITEQETAIERVLSAHAIVHTPVELLPELSEIARKQTDRYATQQDDAGNPLITNPGGYYITTLCNLAKQARAVGFDLKRLKTPARNARTDQAKGRIASGLSATPPPQPRKPLSTAAQSLFDAAERSGRYYRDGR